MNDTIKWEYNRPTRAYYWFPVPDGAPSNWLEPYDYYNGLVYTFYEVLNQPTAEPFGFQFGIWQWQPDSTTKEYWSELMEDTRPVPGGVGSVSINHSKPSDWWYSYDGVEFDKICDIRDLGINIWCLDPESPVADSPWGGREDIWAVQEKWFPLKAYVIVVAVAKDHIFSGWQNYFGKITTGNVLTEIVDKEIQIYPNPAEDKISVLVQNIGKYTIDIIDTQGRLLDRIIINYEPLIVLDVQKYSSGIYILRIISEKKILTKRVIKN